MSPDDWDMVCRIYLEGLATGMASFEVDAPSGERWNSTHHTHSRLVVRPSGRTGCGLGGAEPRVGPAVLCRGGRGQSLRRGGSPKPGARQTLAAGDHRIVGAARHLDSVRRHLPREHGKLAIAAGVRLPH